MLAGSVLGAPLEQSTTGDEAMHAPPRTILVTGATGGIGRAVCHRLAEGGATLLLAARDAGRLHSLCAELPARGAADHAWLSVDMTLDASVRQFADALSAHVDADRKLTSKAW